MPRVKKKSEIKLPHPPSEKVTFTPKILKIFKVPRSRTSTETKPNISPKSEKVPPIPKLVHAPPSKHPSETGLPRPSKRLDKYPHLLRLSKVFKSLLKVEPDKTKSMEKVPPFPKLFHHPISKPPSGKEFPVSPQKFDKYPHLIHLTKAFKSLIFKVEPDKPVRMPKFPTLAFPSLYTRYSIMKTYTAVTDSNGRITVTFPRVFRKIPGVVISPQDGGTWFEHVLSKDEFGFTVQILKTAHKHQYANSGSGGGHYHTGDTVLEGGHTPTIVEGGGVKTSGVSDANYVEGMVGMDMGAWNTHLRSYSNTNCDDPHDCASYTLREWSALTSFTTMSHHHSVNINHLHSASTISDHYHDFDNVSTEPDHYHTVPDSNEKEASLLANTSVTFTYFAQEEA